MEDIFTRRLGRQGYIFPWRRTCRTKPPTSERLAARVIFSLNRRIGSPLVSGRAARVAYSPGGAPTSEVDRLRDGSPQGLNRPRQIVALGGRPPPGCRDVRNKYPPVSKDGLNSSTVDRPRTIRQYSRLKSPCQGSPGNLESPARPKIPHQSAFLESRPTPAGRAARLAPAAARPRFRSLPFRNYSGPLLPRPPASAGRPCPFLPANLLFSPCWRDSLAGQSLEISLEKYPVRKGVGPGVCRIPT